MLTNLKIAFRHLKKNRTFTLINVLGLSIGLAAFMIIYFYVSFENSYDNYHKDSERMYRIVTDNFINGEVTARDAGSFAPTGQFLLDEYPQVEAFSTSYLNQGDFIIKVDDELYVEDQVVFADRSFMDFFSHTLAQGDIANALEEPNSIVLTESLAMKYFGEVDVLGKTIMVYNRIDKPFKVTGVMPDPPLNTHYRFQAICSLSSMKERMEWHGWRYYSYYTYVKLHPEADLEAFVAGIRDIPREQVNPKTTLIFDVQAVPDIHLRSGLDYEVESNGNYKIVTFLSVIGFFILFIAWVNYINLSTAKSMDRVKEIAMKRIIGAERWHLVTQFLIESLLINSISIVVAITLCQLATPFVGDLLPQARNIQYWFEAERVQLILVLYLTSSLCSGLYPAIILSRYRSAALFRGAFSAGRGGFQLRKVLVVFQFGTSLALIVGTLIVYQQVNFMRNRDLGVDLNQVMALKTPTNGFDDRDQRVERIETFKQIIDQRADVLSVGRSSAIPDGGETLIFTWAGGVIVDGQDKEDRSTYSVNWVDAGFMGTLGIDLVAGRFFDINLKSDTSAIMINETARKKLGFDTPEAALGHLIQRGRDSEKFRVVGVIADYNRIKLKHSVAPTFYYFVPRGGFRFFVVKLNGERITETMAHIRDHWESMFPLSPMMYDFLDEQFDKAYKDDLQFGSVFGLFATLAILIACLGLLGLSSFLVIQKTKEIGVRKVLGASVAHIITLLYSSFLSLILVAALLAAPLVHLVMEQWLEGYSYRIDIPLWAYPVAAGILLLISLLTVILQTWKRATANPVTSLRYE